MGRSRWDGTGSEEEVGRSRWDGTGSEEKVGRSKWDGMEWSGWRLERRRTGSGSGSVDLIKKWSAIFLARD